MKILDRYLLKSFLAPWWWCFVAFLLVFVIYDLFDHLTHFLEARTPLMAIVSYYGWLIPSVLVFIMPVSLMLAALYSLGRLTRRQEITALCACGVSMPRLLAPYLALGITASLLVAGVQETMAPGASFRSLQFREEQRRTDRPSSAYVASPLAYRNEREHRVWLIAAFDTRTFEMEQVEVIEESPEGLDRLKIRAERADWVNGSWRFEEVEVQTYGPQGHPAGAPRIESRLVMDSFSETPNVFLKEVKGPEHLSSRELAAYLRARPSLSDEARASARVDYHRRQAMPWTCLAFLLLGVAFGVQSGRRGAMLGTVWALGLFFSYYVILHVFTALGKNLWIDPILATWGPHAAYLAAGAYLAARLR